MGGDKSGYAFKMKKGLSGLSYVSPKIGAGRGGFVGRRFQLVELDDWKPRRLLTADTLSRLREALQA